MTASRVLNKVAQADFSAKKYIIRRSYQGITWYHRRRKRLGRTGGGAGGGGGGGLHNSFREGGGGNISFGPPFP